MKKEEVDLKKCWLCGRFLPDKVIARLKPRVGCLMCYPKD